MIDRILGKYTKVSRERLAAFQSALQTLDRDGIEGDVVECGVWQGGHIILARQVSPLRKCWLYDTFDGMTEPGRLDGQKANEKWRIRGGKKWAAVDLKTVLGNLINENVYDPEAIRFVPGDVRRTLLTLDVPDKIAILHLDTDFYDSTKIELEVLWPRIVPNGILIVDDYGHWEGCRLAVSEYFGRMWPFMEAKQIDYTAVQMRKTA